VTAAANRFSIAKTTKDRVPSLPFFALKKRALGDRYELSLVFVGDARSRSLNVRYRGKTYTPNVLSFPLDDEHGEIFLNLKQAKREHKARGESFEYYVGLLVVHGMLHLKGMKHGSTMEKQEARILAKLGVENTWKV
jgi:probable rRNA maturation factor